MSWGNFLAEIGNGLVVVHLKEGGLVGTETGMEEEHIFNLGEMFVDGVTPVSEWDNSTIEGIDRLDRVSLGFPCRSPG